MSSLMTMTLASLRFLATNGSFIIHRRAPSVVLGYSRTIGEANLLQLSSSKIDGWMCVGPWVSKRRSLNCIQAQQRPTLMKWEKVLIAMHGLPPQTFESKKSADRDKF
ncbi:GM16150 [Drosophila sechellia]|uniref:GM16150 n=1 Tax=Drosophila sechellia TaxID=7238 RepID=B4IIH7_DROSE|nr:GM16150 [Drosophila sechellia]